jgi:hypothetical protein
MSKIIIADIETANQLTEISAEESKAIQGGFFNFSIGGSFYHSHSFGFPFFGGGCRRGCW